MLRVVYFGFELRILDELKNCSHVVGVYAPPPMVSRWKLRDLLLSDYRIRSSLKPIVLNYRRVFHNWVRTLMAYNISDYVRRNHLNGLFHASVKDPALVQAISDLRPDAGVVANFGEILCSDILNLPKLGCINWHPTLLPKYRGPAPFGHMLLNGETRSGVTWHRMTEKVDSGEILSQEEFALGEYDTVNDLSEQSVELGVKLLEPLLQALESGQCVSRPQDEELATYYARLNPEERQRLKEIERSRMARRAHIHM